MKKNFYFAALAGMLALFSACSNDREGSGDQSNVATVLPSVTVQLESSATTYAYPPSTPVGQESRLDTTHLFVWAGTDAAGANAKYKHVVMEPGQTKVDVNFPVVGRNVYVFSNYPNSIMTAMEAYTTDENFEAVLVDFLATKNKAYVAGLKPDLAPTDRAFLMSGKAVVAGGGTPTEAYKLPIILQRDITKATLKVKPVANGLLLDNSDAPTIVSVNSFYVMRSAPKVIPFKKGVGTLLGGAYELYPGYGEENYGADASAKIANGQDISNTENPATGKTDFSFQYKGATQVVTDNDNWTFKNFYVLPNHTEMAARGTILIVEATINIPGGAQNAKRYYKARLSKDFGTYETVKNSHYEIVATLKGPGKDKPDWSEDQSSNMTVEVSVSPWDLIMSSQEIQ